jgi:methionyl-tRNA synthetase
MKEIEKKFEVCKQYIKDNPGANIQKVADDTEVSVKMIKQWVREERLTFAEGSAVGIECEACGANILTGRFCNNCKQSLSNGLNNTIKKPVKEDPARPKREGGKMRFLDD